MTWREIRPEEGRAVHLPFVFVQPLDRQARPPLRMMTEMSRLLGSYGLDVWIWYPAMDRDYSDPKTVQSALAEWGEVFRRLPRVDGVFVPGGDPGHTQPEHLMALLEKQTSVLRRHHPKARVWVSPQGFNAEWMEESYQLQEAEPPWLGGIVHNPQVRVSPPDLRQAVPKRYPIRRGRKGRSPCLIIPFPLSSSPCF